MMGLPRARFQLPRHCVSAVSPPCLKNVFFRKVAPICSKLTKSVTIDIRNTSAKFGDHLTTSRLPGATPKLNHIFVTKTRSTQISHGRVLPGAWDRFRGLGGHDGRDTSTVPAPQTNIVRLCLRTQFSCACVSILSRKWQIRSVV